MVAIVCDEMIMHFLNVGFVHYFSILLATHSKPVQKKSSADLKKKTKKNMLYILDLVLDSTIKCPFFAL